MNATQLNSALVAAENCERNVGTYSKDPFTAILLEHAKPHPREDMVIVACGTGVVARMTAPLVEGNGSVVDLDIDPHMIAVARSLPSPGGEAEELYPTIANIVLERKGLWNLFLKLSTS